MTRRCSHCGHNGHNSRTCPDRGVRLFGVRLADSGMRKSVSMGNLQNYSSNTLNHLPCTPEHSDNAGSGNHEGYISDGSAAATGNTRERKKGIPWTEEEHRLFLLGLNKLGKGDWRGISRSFVQTRTPTQVASHAQKYFIRQSNMNKRKRRSSLFDIGAEGGGGGVGMGRSMSTPSLPSLAEDVSSPSGPLAVPPTMALFSTSLASSSSLDKSQSFPTLPGAGASRQPPPGSLAFARPADLTGYSFGWPRGRDPRWQDSDRLAFGSAVGRGDRREAKAEADVEAAAVHQEGEGESPSERDKGGIATMQDFRGRQGEHGGDVVMSSSNQGSGAVRPKTEEEGSGISGDFWRRPETSAREREALGQWGEGVMAATSWFHHHQHHNGRFPLHHPSFLYPWGGFPAQGAGAFSTSPFGMYPPLPPPPPPFGQWPGYSLPPSPYGMPPLGTFNLPPTVSQISHNEPRIFRPTPSLPSAAITIARPRADNSGSGLVEVVQVGSTSPGEPSPLTLQLLESPSARQSAFQTQRPAGFVGDNLSPSTSDVGNSPISVV